MNSEAVESSERFFVDGVDEFTCVVGVSEFIHGVLPFTCVVGVSGFTDAVFIRFVPPFVPSVFARAASLIPLARDG